MSRAILIAPLLALSLAGPALGGEASIEDLIPADAVVSLCYYGDNPDVGKTALARLVREPEVQQWLASVRDALAGANQLAEPFIRVNVADLAPLLGCRVGVAMVVGQGAPLGGLLVARVGTEGKAREGVDKFVGKLAELLGGAGPAGEVGGVALTQFGRTGACFGIRGGYLILGTSSQAVGLALSPQVPKLASLPAFARARTMTGSPIAVLTYNHEALTENLGPMLPPEVRALFQGIGLDGARTVGLRLGARGRALVGTFFIQTQGERRGLLKALASPPIDKSLLRLAPRDAAIAWAMNVEPGELYDAVAGLIHAITAARLLEGADVRGAIGAFEAKAGLSLRRDLFGALGRGTVITTSGRSILFPTLIVSQAARDPDRFDRAVGKLVPFLDALIKGEAGPQSGAVLKTVQFGGHTIRYLAMPGVPVPLAPCYARAGGRIVFALAPVHLKDYLVFLDKGEPSILDHPGYQELARLVPPNAVSVAYTDIGESLVQAYGLLGPLVASLPQAIPNSPVAVDLVNLPSKRVLRKHLFGGISYTYLADDLIVYESHSPVGLAPAGAPTVFAGAFLAGLALPAVVSAREEARRVVSMSNLRQLSAACMMYANGHKGQLPPGLASLLELYLGGAAAILLAPADRAPPKGPGGHPCSYAYALDKRPALTLRLPEIENPAEMPLIWERASFYRGGRRAVAFVDGHVEMVDAERFDRLMKALEEQLKKLAKPRGGKL